MARPRIDDDWIEQIRRQASKDKPKLSAAKIRSELVRWKVQAEKRGERTPPGDPPSTRAITRVMKEHRAAPRKEYEYFQWPQSMLDGSLPWEASRIVLDLVRAAAERRLTPPLVKEAQWFYWITLAIPDAPFEQRMMRAYLFASGRFDVWGERVFAFQPWRSEGDHAAFDRACQAWGGKRSGLICKPPATEEQSAFLRAMFPEYEIPAMQQQEGASHGRKSSTKRR
jgi:hypothetical protein